MQYIAHCKRRQGPRSELAARLTSGGPPRFALDRALGLFPVRLSPAVTASNKTELMDLEFAGTVIEWRGPSPYYFVAVPADDAADINEIAAMATYGWGRHPG